jgi:DNA mismatch repair protein MutH
MNSLSKNEKEIFINIFSKYYGKTYQQLIVELELQYDGKIPKNIGNIITKSILLKAEKEGLIILEGIIIKTIRVNESGTPLESMSFAQIKYKEIVKEEWGESYLYNTLNKEFLFVIFKLLSKEDRNPTLSKAMFWKMNSDDLDLASKFWALTKDSIIRGDFKNFITIKNNFICHVRSKGLNGKDLMETPQGTMEPKKGYWLNASYIKSQIL